MQILCMSWTHDGLHLALGFFSGHIHLCDKNGTEKVNITRNAPVWSLAWSSSAFSSGGAGQNSTLRHGKCPSFMIL